MIENIVKGWGNVIKDKFDLLPEKTKELSTERLLTCETCSLRVMGVCSPSRLGPAVKNFSYHGNPRKQGEIYKGCGCGLAAKSTVENEQCPLGKWFR